MDGGCDTLSSAVASDRTPCSVLFLKLNKMFFGYFNLEKFFFNIMRIHILKIELNDISAQFFFRMFQVWTWE